MDTASAAGKPPPFLSKTYDMVDDPATDSIVSWGPRDNSFVVWNVPDFSRDLLPNYFKHRNFSSFLRQLNTYGFRKVDPDRFEFAHEDFLRGQKSLLKTIGRRRSGNNPPSQTALHHEKTADVSLTGSCIEVGSFGMKEEVERLKRDRGVLMQELIRLRQQQQVTDSQLAGVGRRVQAMEQRLQQMMSFLAKSMQRQGFFAQLLQQHSKSNKRMGDANKKRRLAEEEENDFQFHGDVSSPDGRIVKYRPSLNKTSKTMMHEIPKMDAPPRPDGFSDDPESFQSDKFSSPSLLHSHASSNLTSGLSLTEVSQASVQSKISVDWSFSASYPAGISDSQSSSHAVKNEKPAKQMAADGHVQRVNVEVTDPNVEVIDPNVAIYDAADVGYINRSLTNVGGPIDVKSDLFLPEDCAENLLDDVPTLPEIDNVFWEHFLAATSLPPDTDEIDSTSPVTGPSNETFPRLERGSKKAHFMDGLTEQMGLLSSSSIVD